VSATTVYKVTARAVFVRAGKAQLMLRRGTVIPLTVEDDEISRLLTEGLITPVTITDEDTTVTDEDTTVVVDAPKRGGRPRKTT